MKPEITAFVTRFGLTYEAQELLETLVDDLVGEKTEARPPGPVERYEDLGLLGAGGMGEVRRVRDRELNRVVAMKTLRVGMLHRPRAVARFVEEAQATSQLQHPNIVPIYDIGVTDDGRPWFTMRELRGRTFGEVIAEVHEASGEEWTAGPSGWTFRRTVDAFHQVCRAVAFAHARGVVHRDLKPENVMIGTYGEVTVVDWGLAKILGARDWAAELGQVPTGELDVEALKAALAKATPVQTARATEGMHRTRDGTVAGTPIYMSPEQARGEVDQIDARSDVYALGTTLFQVLTGQAPFAGETDPAVVIARVSEGYVDTIPEDSRVPPALVAICHRAMSRDPGDRYQSAGDLAAEVQAWLDDERRRAQALVVLDDAIEHEARAEDLEARAETHEARAAALLEGVQPSDPEERKHAGWAEEDAAADLRSRAALERTTREQGVHASLRIDPELPDARVLLAQQARRMHEAAEQIRDHHAMAQAQAQYREHASALPRDHAERRAWASYIRGTGALTLVTDPEGAEVELFRYVTRHRRLVAEPVRHLGRTPIVELPLEMDSYLCVIRHPDRSEVRYPVHVARGQHWHGVPPGGSAPQPIALPRPGELGPDDCYVPAGWFVAGGDPEVRWPIDRHQLWADAFVIRRFPVTHGELIAFLDDLVDQGRESEALRHAPKKTQSNVSKGGLIYARDAHGHFHLTTDSEGDTWLADWPAFMVDFATAVAWCRWQAARTGLPWRLPGEFEWEKAARGVDGRWFPWGDQADYSWAQVFRSEAKRPFPAVVDSRPVDESVFGLRGAAGNVRDWCADLWQNSPDLSDQRAPAPAVPEDVDLSPKAMRTTRGGDWDAHLDMCHIADRPPFEPLSRPHFLGFRAARSYDPER